MTVLATSPAAATRNAGPSLYKLVSGLPDARRLRQPADALVIIGRQLELVMQNQGLSADVALGTLRFSLFRLHQGRIAQLAPHCRSITVYGEADVEPPAMEGVEFVALPPGSPLSQEWFFVIDSPYFWGALITQAVPERANGTVRRYLFEGALTADERVVSRAKLLLSLAQRRPAPDIGTRYPLANQAHWALVAHHLATHPESERLNLTQSLSELPELLETTALHGQPADLLIPHALEALQHHAGTVGGVFYRCEGESLTPIFWGGQQRPQPMPRQSGIIGRALEENAPVLTPLVGADPERQLLHGAQSAIAVPVLVHDRAWGVMLVGLAEATPEESPAAARVIGVAALIEQILGEHGGPDLASSAQRPQAAAPTPQWGAASAPASANGYAPAPPQAPANGYASANGYAPAPPQAPANGYAPAPPQAPANGYANTPAPAAPSPSGNAFGLPSWMRSAAPPAARALPGAPAPSGSSFPSASELQNDRSFATLQKRLMGALVAFDQRSAEQVWGEACGSYSTEAICTELLMPVQIAVGEGWHRGEVSVAAEHFCSRFVEGKLLNLLNSYIDNTSGPLAIIGCAQAEMHELGAIMLSLFMKWAGFRVIYLGQNVPNSTIEETVRQLRPQILGLSATTVEAAHNLTEAGQIITRIEPPRPQFIFGGMAFYERPDLRGRIPGRFLEGDVRQIVRDLAAQFKK